MTDNTHNPIPDKSKTAKGLRGISKGTTEVFPKDRSASRPNPKARFKRRKNKR